MVVEFVVNYLKTIVESMGIEVTLTPSYSDGLIRIKLVTNHNSILIGKDGETLQALNEICRSAANSKYKRRVRVLLDINDYKQEKSIQTNGDSRVVLNYHSFFTLFLLKISNALFLNLSKFSNP